MAWRTSKSTTFTKRPNKLLLSIFYCLQLSWMVSMQWLLCYPRNISIFTLDCSLSVPLSSAIILMLTIVMFLFSVIVLNFNCCLYSYTFFFFRISISLSFTIGASSKLFYAFQFALFANNMFFFFCLFSLCVPPLSFLFLSLLPSFARSFFNSLKIFSISLLVLL